VAWAASLVGVASWARVIINNDRTFNPSHPFTLLDLDGTTEFFHLTPAHRPPHLPNKKVFLCFALFMASRELTMQMGRKKKSVGT
jgi:hypothetical protein